MAGSGAHLCVHPGQGELARGDPLLGGQLPDALNQLQVGLQRALLEARHVAAHVLLAASQAHAHLSAPVQRFVAHFVQLVQVRKQISWKAQAYCRSALEVMAPVSMPLPKGLYLQQNHARNPWCGGATFYKPLTAHDSAGKPRSRDDANAQLPQCRNNLFLHPRNSRTCISPCMSCMSIACGSLCTSILTSTSRVHRLHSSWQALMGWMACARLISSAEASEMPR